ncbi:Putative invertase inhibitor [Apostasia shenzhenica]|uniref:Invertase inhibitor n=1 Tax=Apostasia shenzhenica TaxID=1088818 RepID=A0A2I0B974_9ASPA|nr:Putative invertase inhibitor [Apostasia shenzhenica]
MSIPTIDDFPIAGDDSDIHAVFDDHQPAGSTCMHACIDNSREINCLKAQKNIIMKLIINLPLAILLPINSILLCQIFCFYSVEVEAASIVEETCRKVAAFPKPTSPYDFCVATLRADPKSANADIRGLTVIAAEQAAVDLRAALDRIKDLLGGSKATKEDKKSLRVCKECFEIAVSYLGDAIADLKSDKMFFARSLLGGTPEDVITCREAFEEGGDINIFAKEIQDAALYASLPADIVSLIN